MKSKAIKKSMLYALLSMLCVCGVAENAAQAAPQNLTKTPQGYKVTYQYQDQPQIKNWYVGGKLIGNWAFFTETRSSDNTGVNVQLDKQTTNGAMQFGGAAFVGTKLTDSWRAELELGYLGKYTNAGPIDFSLATPYASVNANYNTVEQKWGWFYVGAGLGVAMPMTTLTSHVTSLTLVGGGTKTNVGPMGAIMLGYRAHIADNWFVDIGYKFMAYDGGSRTNQYSYASDPATTYNFTEKLGWIMNHSINVGLAWEF